MTTFAVDGGRSYAVHGFGWKPGVIEVAGRL